MPEITPETQKAVVAALKLATKTDPTPRTVFLQKIKDYLRGEQVGANFEYWPGLSLRPEASAEERAQYIRQITVDNILTPAVDRFVSHSIGRDAEWGLTAEGQDEPLKPEDEWVKAGTAWHKASRLHSHLMIAGRDALGMGESYLRMLIPESYGEVNQGGRDLPQALRLIRVHTTDATQAGVIEDAAQVITAYWYAYSVLDDQGKSTPHVEIHTRESIGQYRVNGDKLEQVKIVENPLLDPTDPLASRFLMFRLRRDRGAMIGQSEIDVQNNHNAGLYAERRILDAAAHRQWYTTNAADPEDAEGQPTYWQFGMNRVVSPKGLPGTDLQGNPTYTPVGIGVFDPPDSTPLIAITDHFRKALLERFDQLWTVSEGQISGESKRESRAAFDRRLGIESEPMAAALAWAIETALQFGGWLVGDAQAAQARTLTCTPRLFLDTLPVDNATLTLYAQLQAAGQLSLETLTENIGAVADSAVEVARIEAERKTNPTAILAALEVGGMDKADAQRALKAAGYPITAEAIARAEEMGSLEVAGMESDAAPTTTPRPAPQAAYAIGDRVQVKADSEHAMGGMTMGGAGTVEIIGTPALGIRLDDMPNEVHKWYVAEELQSEGVTQ